MNRAIALSAMCMIFPTTVFADILPTATADLTQLSLEELMNVEVMSVSRHSEKLIKTASAVQVVTNRDIHRSGATSLPEALRLAPNLQVAQINSHDWAITARGFNSAPLANNGLANKLLVMIDGRSVYTPLFGGVFWDVQNVLLEDIEQIEVVSGPGGALWGSNAVNGVINIVSKSAKDTQGLYASGAAGSFLRDSGEIRYGGKVNEDLYYRVYAQRADRLYTRNLRGANGKDDWYVAQGGFRMDYEPQTQDTFTLQGDFYDNSEGFPTTVETNGENMLGRWTRAFSEESELSVQMYVDHTWRRLKPSLFSDNMVTGDIELQHRFPLGEIQSLTWGLGYRHVDNKIDNVSTLRFIPTHKKLRTLSGFVQDEISLFSDQIRITLGTKIEDNEYSGLELQPNARLAWSPAERHTIWTAISRAIHAPTRFDADTTVPLVVNEDFDSEKLIAYETGYRVQLIDPLMVSISGYYHDYEELRSLNSSPVQFANDQEGFARGIELSAQYQVLDWWRLRGGYNYLDKKIRSVHNTVFTGSDIFEGIDPQGQLLIQSNMDLPRDVTFDVVGRHVKALPASTITSTPIIPAYTTFDVRLGWQYDKWEFSIVGQNLWSPRHPEFGSPGTALRIPRSVYVEAELRW